MGHNPTADCEDPDAPANRGHHGGLAPSRSSTAVVRCRPRRHTHYTREPSTGFGPALRAALAGLATADPAYRPIVHKTIVWSKDSDAWPSPMDPTHAIAGIRG